MHIEDRDEMYASAEESAAVIQPDTRTETEKRLDAMLEARGANEQGVGSVAILRDIAVDLLGQPVLVPQGWQLVPVEPTKEMLNAGAEDLRIRGLPLGLLVGASECYRVMLNAAPAAPDQAERFSTSGARVSHQELEAEMERLRAKNEVKQ